MSLNNRILIGAPVYGDVSGLILEDWMAFMYHLGRRMPDHDFFLGIKTKTEQFRARNMIVEAAQLQNCDRILMIDDDMVIDHERIGRDSYEFIKKLIAHDKDICGIRYYQRGQECQPVLMKKLNEKGYRFLRDDEIENQLQRVDVAGGGCLLIKTKVFDRIPYPYFAPEYEFGTDIQLCRKAAEKGFEVWADTSIEIGHARKEQTVITSANRHLFQESTQTGVTTKFVMSDVYTRLVEDAKEYTGFQSEDEIWYHADKFMNRAKRVQMTDAEWYRQYPKERVCRQVWFNTQTSGKKLMTQYILAGIQHQRPLRILDFGCGIGLTAFSLAEKGHSVVAMDIRGTGTLEFLKWRAAKHNVPIEFWESEGGVPKIRGEFDVIIAMDCIEHIEDWPGTIRTLAEHIRPQGLLFSNNGILDDVTHAEHYELRPKDFINMCMESALFPHTQISYVKHETPQYETVA